MKIKLMPIFAGVAALTLAAAPLAAQGCQGNKDKAQSNEQPQPVEQSRSDIR
jgi:hypothetical protein